MLDIPQRVRVHVEALLAAQNDMGVCDANEQYAPAGKPEAMTTPRLPKVAGIDSPPGQVPPPAPSVAPASPVSQVTSSAVAPGAVIQDRLAGWVSDLTTLHELTERLARTAALEDALHELLRAGATLVGARRGLVVLEPGDGRGPDTTIGLGLSRPDLGHIETVPRGATSYGRILDGLSAEPEARADLLAEDALDPRHREVAARLGYAASYAMPLATEAAGRLGAAVWLYDEPAEPVERQRHLIGLYARYATEHLARLLELERTRAWSRTVADELLPPRLPRVAGVQLAARHRTGPRGGGDWYDA
ncbi:phosphatase, partial [Streptomyces endophyticus]|nr:phosphatase [Streptomyces endophyticus]